jgi:hypothetical protein
MHSLAQSIGHLLNDADYVVHPFCLPRNTIWDRACGNWFILPIADRRVVCLYNLERLSILLGKCLIPPLSSMKRV